MRELLGVLFALALMVGASMLAVHVAGDRELMVPPPDAVAEGFTREVMSKRWPRAKEYLLEPESRSREELEALQRELGEGENVEAETIVHDGTRAVVTVRVPERNVVKNYSLIFDDQWKIR